MIRKNLSEKEYRSNPAISRSELFKLKDSPEKFKYAKENPPEPTAALVFGQAFHKIVLEPDTFDEEFAVAPVVDRRTTEGKAAWAKFTEDSVGKTVIDMATYDTITAMAQSVLSAPYCAKLLKGEHELPIFWTDEDTDEDCKCRLDVLTKIGDKLCIVDLKSAESCETETFTREAIKYGYDLQTAMYSEGVGNEYGELPMFVFIVVEKKPPYAVNILQTDELFYKRGYDLYRELLGKYHECKTEDDWYGQLGKYKKINILTLPPYLAKEYEE